MSRPYMMDEVRYGFAARNRRGLSLQNRGLIRTPPALPNADHSFENFPFAELLENLATPRPQSTISAESKNLLSLHTKCEGSVSAIMVCSRSPC